MKGLIKKIALCLLAFVAVFGLAACEEDTPEVETPEQVAAAKESALEELAVAIDSVDKAEYSQDVLDVIAQIKAYGELFIGNSTTVASVANSLSTILTHFEEYLGAQIPLANGAYSYVASSYEARTEILGILEAYAVKAGLTGITVYEDSGFVMYHESVKKGTESYIPGYGFGVVTEGELTADLQGEANAAWKRYYHTYEAEDPKTLNYGDDKGSVVGGLVGYIMGSYWGTKMNETKDGYEWYSDLASEKPQPQNANPETGLATTYKFEIKTGEDLKYNTLSTKFAAYKGREVVKEDYLTPWKLLYTQANGWARGTENHEGAAAVKGIAQYYNASADGFNAEAWENVGVKVSTENGKDYMTIEFVTPCTPFYAMYYAASSLYAPIPEEFINEDGIGAANYGKFNVAAGLTPVDTTLSTGPYVVEQWDQDQQIVFKKNELYCNADLGLYKIAGIHFNILAASTSDPEAGLKEFLANKIHATGIPSTKLDEYKNDPRTLQTVGETTTKLNVNTCTQEEWEKLFGVNGTIAQTERADYWECEPALSNEDFVMGLSYAINRLEFATEKGRTPSVSYFGAGYMADPEKGISYNSTQAHADAIAQLIEGTDGYGYSLEKARAAFDKAARALLASGAYQAGDTIELEIAWQSQSNVTVYHNAIKNYWETAFNHESVADRKLTLEVVDYVPATWSDVYYKKMMVGQFDIGFGGISGNPLNPINFLEVLKSDNSSGFTLNWGPDTSVVSTDLVWEGRAWSFDTLWKVADTGGYVESGVIVPVIDPALKTGLTMNADGTSTYEINANIITADKVEVAVDKMVIFGYDSTQAYMEDAVSFEIVDGVIKVTVNAELTAKYAAALPLDGYMGIDVYFTTTICGVPSSGYATVYTSVVPAPAE